MAGAFFCLETELEELMHSESKQYHFARIEGYRIALAHLEDQFRDAAVNLEQMDAAVVEQLAKETLCAP